MDFSASKAVVAMLDKFFCGIREPRERRVGSATPQEIMRKTAPASGV
jgi:hypothetical protein